MINRNAIGQSAGWHDRPLCCRYLLVHFDALTLQVRESGSQSDRTVCWALGAHAEGQCEVLGVWPTSPSGDPDWREVFEGLAARGVERIRFVVSAGPNAVQAAEQGATMLTWDSQKGSSNSQSLAALSFRLRRIVESAQAHAQLMRAELGRLTRRHGPFDSTAAASHFLEKALERMDRRFWMGTPVREPSADRRAMSEPRAAAF